MGPQRVKKVILDVEVYQFALHQSLPCVKGKRSAVAVVNDSPVGCQSRDRVARRRLGRRKPTRRDCAVEFYEFALNFGEKETFCRDNPSVTLIA